MFKILLHILLAVALSCFTSAASSNFVVVDSLCTIAVANLVQHLPANREVTLSIPEHPARWLMEQHVQRSVRITKGGGNENSSMLMIGIADCAVRYTLAGDRDSLLRDVRLELRCSVDQKPIENILMSYRDVIARTDVKNMETPGYEFCSSTVPPVPRSTWDDLVEPLIILTALATTVVLLFTVRSQ